VSKKLILLLMTTLLVSVIINVFSQGLESDLIEQQGLKEDINVKKLEKKIQKKQKISNSKINIKKIGDWGTGVYEDIHVKGDFAYCAAYGSGLDIINISDKTNPKKVSNCDTSGYARGIYVKGNYAFVADYDNGLVIINVSDPSSPSIVGNYDNSGSGVYVYDVFIKDNYAYLVEGDDGLEIIEISNTSSPFLVGNYNSNDFMESIYVNGSYAFVADYDDGLVIIDISDPSSPSFKGSYKTSGNAFGIFVRNGYVYLVDGNLKIINVSNLSSPSLESIFITPGYAYDVYVVGDYAYVADRNEGLQIIDISDPSSPSLAGSCDTSGRAEGVFVNEDYTYVADWSDGLQVINVSNPLKPWITGNYNKTGRPDSVYVKDNYAYLADYYNGLQIINISNSSSPFLVGHYETPGHAYDVYVVGNYAYVADRNEGLQIIDISDPSSPSLAGSCDTSGIAWGIYVSGNFAYIADGDKGLKVIDVSTPSSPFPVGEYSTNGNAMDVHVKSNYAYLVNRDDGSLHIIDISIPSSPSLTGKYNTYGGSNGLFVKDNYAYVLYSYYEFQIIDVSISSSPKLLGSVDLYGDAWDVFVKGKYAYLTDSWGGMQIIDISTPTNSKVVGNYDITKSSHGIYVNENNIYLSDRYSGKLYILDVDLPGIDITTPNGGENFRVGTVRNITWTTSGSISDVKIEYSTDNGSNWKSIVVSTANDGVYEWTVPDDLSSQCVVRVKDESDETIFDISDSVFTIYALAPELNTSAITEITHNSAFSGGTITSNGGVSVTARGVCWNTTGSPTTSDTCTSDGTGTGSFTSSLTGLTPGTDYYVRAYATNSVGTSYGNQRTFTTHELATVITSSMSNIGAKTAISGGNVTDTGGTPVINKGVCWNTTGSPTTSDTCTRDGTGTGSFTSSITGLTPGTTYYVRAYATNSVGTSYGQQEVFTTLPINNIELVQPEDNAIVRGTVKIKAGASIKEDIVEFYVDDNFLGNGKLETQENRTFNVENVFDIQDASYLFIDKQDILKKITPDNSIKDVFEFKVKVDDIRINRAGEIFIRFMNGISLENKGFYNWIKINTTNRKITGVVEPQLPETQLTENNNYIKNIVKNRIKMNKRIDKVFRIDEKEYIFSRVNNSNNNTALIRVRENEKENKFNILGFIKETPIKIIKNTLNRPFFPIKIEYKMNEYYSTSGKYLYSIDWNTLNHTTGVHSIKVSAEDEHGRAASDEINVTVRNLIIELNAVRKSDKAFTFEVHFVELNVEIDNPGNIQVSEYIIHRKTDNGSYEQIAVIEPSELNNTNYIYYDKNLNPDKSYTYKITAHNSSGEIISVSEEKTI